MYFYSHYSQLVCWSRLLNNTAIIEENVASGDRVINDAKENRVRKRPC